MSYLILQRRVFTNGAYSLCPIREDDIEQIRVWRNEQMSILRQQQEISVEAQITYFEKNIWPTFRENQPPQILFSFLQNERLIGYGGLVHIDWVAGRAEISFLLETSRNHDIPTFQKDFSAYLTILKEIAFNELHLFKINTEAYDIRPYLYKPLQENGFEEEGRLKAHNLINGKRVDTIFHSLFFSNAASPEFNILVTSISRKVPLLQRVKEALNRLYKPGRLFGGDIDEKCLGRHFVDHFWKMPALSAENLHEILDYCESNQIVAIIPTRDGELQFWSKHKYLFTEKSIEVMISCEEAINVTIDKYEFYRSGVSLNAPVIKTSLNISEEFGAPFVVKERYGAGAKSIGINLDRVEALDHSSTLNHPIFQPFIRGREYSIDIFMTEQSVARGVVCRRRSKIFNGESEITTTESKTVLANLCADFAVKLKLTGHVIFQAIEDDEHNYHIIECNPRFGGASTLSVEAGLDSFYWFLHKRICGAYPDETYKPSYSDITQIRIPSDLYRYD